ncbi:hypothetical protein NBRC111894_3639 [Sporolactobacillus inulinus]|uniref:Uncharacterized protein n=1 Tax=Sporolactobacillus inulinus TaxID=2078 RepID=A0A4Y1ZG59_9BACL|nr:hypothetical protein NBRC111894_3639 [Sporolactobacillus inulinus]
MYTITSVRKVGLIALFDLILTVPKQGFNHDVSKFSCKI